MPSTILGINYNKRKIPREYGILKAKGRGRNERRGGAEKVGGVKLPASLTTTSAGAPMSRSVPNFPDKRGSHVAEVRASEFLSCSPASVGARQ